MLKVKAITAERLDQKMGPTEKTAAWVGPRAWTRGTVLVIEGETLIRRWLQWVLHSRGYEVVTATTAQEAEAVLCQLGARHIGLVIVDVHLRPASDIMAGYQLYQIWKWAYPTMPFLLMSDDTHDRKLTAVQEGSVQLLIKRFLIADLMDAVRSLYGRAPTAHDTSPITALTG
jgi:DNA-binding response OmpR family regulator